MNRKKKNNNFTSNMSSDISEWDISNVTNTNQIFDSLLNLNNLKKEINIKYIKFEDKDNKYKIKEKNFKDNLRNLNLSFKVLIRKKKNNNLGLSGIRIINLYDLMEIEEFRERYYKIIKSNLKEDKLKEFNNFVRGKIDNKEWNELENKSIFF